MLESLRIKHWIKNIIIFAAPLFALKIQPESLALAGMGFLAFSFLSSAFYLVNDVKDVEKDRHHPAKSKRPIARGDLSVFKAITLAVFLAAVSIAGGFYLNTAFGILLCIYAILQILYNWKLKQIAIIDMMVIALGFVLRALGGALIVSVEASGWFLLCVGFLAFFLAIEKRKAELSSDNSRVTRKVLSEYSLDWLRRMEHVATSAAIVTYSLWTIESNQSKWFLITIPLVVYVIFKYQQLSETEMAETPELIMMKNPMVLLAIILWGGISLLILLAVNEYQW